MALARDDIGEVTTEEYSIADQKGSGALLPDATKVQRRPACGAQSRKSEDTQARRYKGLYWFFGHRPPWKRRHLTRTDSTALEKSLSTADSGLN
jgi:hypothetical protein